MRVVNGLCRKVGILRKLALTFDDGLLNTYEVAYPILRDLGIKATLFVVSGAVCEDIPPEQVRPVTHDPLMHWPQVRQLAAEGWEIGSHSHTHRVFDTITDDAAEHEFDISKTLLQGFGFNPVSFAFPAGHSHYRGSQVDLALKYYRNLRGVSWSPINYKRFYEAYPVDSYPTIPLEGETVVTCHHRILEPERFRGWLESLKATGVEFLRLKDL